MGWSGSSRKLPSATHALGPAQAAVAFVLALVPFVALEVAKALAGPQASMTEQGELEERHRQE